MRLVFMGTPPFAVPALTRLCESGLVPVAVYSQPPRAVGRGLRPAEPLLAIRARELGLHVRQPEVLQRPDELARLSELAPDVIVTVAYGKIFRRRLLELPRRGCLNLHPSLLPRYRGLSPIQRAVLRGDSETGVTLYRMVAAIDAGALVAQQAVAIEEAETAAHLTARLALAGADLIARSLRAWVAGEITPREQDASRASFAPRMERSDGLIDWRLPARQIAQLVRAMTPWPGTYTYCRAMRVKVLSVVPVDEIPRRVPPGTLLSRGKGRPPLVATLPGAVELVGLQPENARPQDAIAFCCGQRLVPGDRLTGAPAGDGTPHE
jgi:methionyl-tRNA formyltransferase